MIEPCTHLRHRVDQPTTPYANFDNVLHRVPRCLGLQKHLTINPSAAEFLNLYADSRFLCQVAAHMCRDPTGCERPPPMPCSPIQDFATALSYCTSSITALLERPRKRLIITSEMRVRFGQYSSQGKSAGRS